MKKILINVYVPSIEKKYELFVPQNKTIGGLIELIVKGVSEMLDSNLDFTNYNLYNKETGIVIDENRTLYELNILNGDSFLLV